MRKAFWLLLLATAALAANTVATTGVPIDTHPQPPTEYEFYWDDGIAASAWSWYTGGNYWAVQFDEVKTEGQDGHVTRVGAATTYSSWPGGTSGGFYMHIFDGEGGYPGEDLWWDSLPAGGGFQWIEVEPPQPVHQIFFVAAQQIGDYPQADGIYVDAMAGTHNWTGYQGSWAPTTTYGDFMLRCYWDDGLTAVEDISWGRVKALY